MEFYTNVHRKGNNILYRGVKDGRRFDKKIPFKPELFLKERSSTGDVKTIFGDPVSRKEFDTISKMQAFTKEYDGVNGMEIFGMQDPVFQFIGRTFQEDIEYDIRHIKIYSVDIETGPPTEPGFPNVSTANAEIVLIGVQDFITRKSFIFGTKPFNKKETDNFEFSEFRDEKSMLLGFISWWKVNYPDIISGWNIVGFDVPFLINRINKLFGEDYAEILSPWGNITPREFEFRGMKISTYKISGISILDYLDVYKKFSFTTQPSYKLGDVAASEIGISKLELEGSFADQINNQWDDFVRYNARDVELIFLIDDKRKFFDLCVTLAYLSRCNFSDVLMPSVSWDSLIYSFLLKKNQTIPPNIKNERKEIKGAWVFEPKPSLVGWMITFDFGSLYPSIMRQWNISPETIVDVLPVGVDDLMDKKCEDHLFYAKQNDYTIAGNGAIFHKQFTGVIPSVVKFVLDGRKIAKKEMLRLEQLYNDTKDESLLPKIAALNSKQMAFKVTANSLYGILLLPSFRYYDARMAEAITLTGQYSNKHLARHFNKFLNQVCGTVGVDYQLAGDTDSDFFSMETFVERFCDGKTEDEIVNFLIKCDDKFQVIINQSIDEVFAEMNCYEKTMSSKREKISSATLFTAKKKYFTKVHNSEGVSYNPPEIMVTGLEMVRSSTPTLIRDFLMDSIPYILGRDEKKLHAFVEECKGKFMSAPIEEIAFPRGVNGMEAYATPAGFLPSTPIQVRAAMVYNRAIEKLQDRYTKIATGDKIRFVYLKMPNPLKQNVVGFQAYAKLPPEFGVEKYIDKDLQWEKVFLEPLKNMINVIGWSTEEKSSLEDFFG